MFKGLWVALVTPFRGGKLDEKALRALTRHVLAGGVNGLVPLGTTGEAATQDDAERARVLEIVLEEAAGKVPVMPGTGSNCTATTVRQTVAARKAGAQAALVVTPYYNKPTPEGQVAHFEAVAAAAQLPIMIYNIPGRTAVNMTVETLLHLARLSEIQAVKEASGSLDQASELVAGAAERGLDFAVMSGDDSLTLPLMSVGGTGVVSVIGNLVPRLCRDMLDAAEAGRRTEAVRMHGRMLPLIKALFSETNPGPAKHLLHQMGICENELRLPMIPVRPATAARLDEVWRTSGLGATASAR